MTATKRTYSHSQRQLYHQSITRKGQNSSCADYLSLRIETVGSRVALAAQGYSRAGEGVGNRVPSRFAQPFATAHAGLAPSIWVCAELLLMDGEGLKQPPNVSLSKTGTAELQVSGEKTAGSGIAVGK